MDVNFKDPKDTLRIRTAAPLVLKVGSLNLREDGRGEGKTDKRAKKKTPNSDREQEEEAGQNDRGHTVETPEAAAPRLLQGTPCFWG